MFGKSNRFAKRIFSLLLTVSLFGSSILLIKAEADSGNNELPADNLGLFADKETLFVTPESFGAKGDGVTDDTYALQKAIDSKQPVLLLPKTYRVSSTIQITGPTSISDSGSTILYDGRESAIRFAAVSNRCNVHLGRIYAENGTGIEFYCDSNTNACQYINLYFSVIRAKNYGIFFNRNGNGSTSENGWLNEIRIYDGRLSSGAYGIYADAHGLNCINNIKCINVAFEGVDVGAFMANGCRGWSFLNVRIAEMDGGGKAPFITVGRMVGLNILSNDAFRCWKSNFSSETQGTIIAPIYVRNLEAQSVLAGNIGEIIDGQVYTNSRLMQSLQRFEELEMFTDLDTVTVPGNYACSYTESAQSLRNAPAAEPFTMFVSCAGQDGRYITQEIHLINAVDVFRRTYYAEENLFSSWQKSASFEELESLQEEVDELRDMIEELQNSITGNG